MVVKTQSNGREVTGLYIGAANAKRHFSQRSSAIDLRLGELQIQCSLPANFWGDVPEIHDPRLSEWLQFKVLHGQTRRAPVSLAMVPCGLNSFMLRAVSADEQVDDTAMNYPLAVLPRPA